MAKTQKRILKCILDVATHPSFTAGSLLAGSYDFNVTESLPKGALVTEIKGNETTSLAGGTNFLVKVGSGTGQVLTAATSSATWAGITTIAISADAQGEVITSTGNLGFTSVGNYTAGVVEVFVEYIY
jgi:hypothetical protein